MKILIVNTYDRGGAANACIRLHMGLLSSGVDSKLLLLHKTRKIPNSFEFKPSGTVDLKVKLKRLYGNIRNRLSWIPGIDFYSPKFYRDEQFLKARNASLEWFSYPNSYHDITTSKFYREADIVNLHWVATFLDYSSFFNKNTKPVVWTLHDMNPFTGGEHYVEKYFSITGSGYPIKRVFSELEQKIDANNLDLKIQSLRSVNFLTIVTPSSWLFKQSKESLAFNKFDHHLIPYGLNEQVFQIRNSITSRKSLNISSDKKVILFVADSVNNSRKGFNYLKRALESLPSTNIILCSIGNDMPSLDTKIENIHLGPISDEVRLSEIFSLADVFVIPSLMDNLPNTVLESLLCGTPVVGFPIGGILDMIDDHYNGLVTEAISVDALTQSLNLFLTQGVKLSSPEIRNQAIAKYSSKIQAGKYKKLFDTIIKS